MNDEGLADVEAANSLSFTQIAPRNWFSVSASLAFTASQVLAMLAAPAVAACGLGRDVLGTGGAGKGREGATTRRPPAGRARRSFRPCSTFGMRVGEAPRRVYTDLDAAWTPEDARRESVRA